MDMSGLSIFQLIGQRLNWVGQRQDVTAQNIANASTPGYQSEDLVPFESHLRRSPGARNVVQVATHSAHIGHPASGSRATAHDGGSAVRQERVRDPAEVDPNGNSVSLEQELMNVAENAANHEMALNLYRKQMGMIRTAIGARGGG
ncbi:flagellar basal body rod protein FlgB [Fodinicurvata sp. EGI_FJ10296]|uniref:flagellar basal body rod protein FlgB n=1 Tax=Fodinicurvata sp. EGI_FJ10296 TaxID=3231908 RepID=UPI0034511876